MDIKKNKLLLISTIIILISLIGCISEVAFKTYSFKGWVLLILIGITLIFFYKPLKDKNINKFESYLFFFGWTIIFYLGADFPVPIGFIFLMFLTLVLTIIQSKYLKYLLPRIDKEKTFLKTAIIFIISSFILSLMIIFIYNYIGIKQTLIDQIIWCVVVTSIGSIYGICFWLFNKYLIKKIVK